MLARIRRLQIRARRLVRLLFLGEYHSVFRGRGLEFSEVREYEPGDEVRLIDWNVTARMGAPYIKKYVEERELVLYLLVDVSASSGFSSTAVDEARAGGRAGDPAGLRRRRQQRQDGPHRLQRPRRALPAAEEGPAARPAHGARACSTCEPKGSGTNIAAATDFLMRVTKRPGVAFLISDFHARGFEASLRLAAQKHDLTAISLTDPRELELPRAGLIDLRDPETGARGADRHGGPAASASASRRPPPRR